MSAELTDTVGSHPLAARLRRRVFGIPADAISFASRGFRGAGEPARPWLEFAASTFVDGYHAALLAHDVQELAFVLERVPLANRGFAYEGAAMALAILDMVTPWKRRRLAAFLRGPADEHLYMAHIGAGWALARLRRRVESALRGFDPLLGWLAVDGYGFHEGFFHTVRSFEKQHVPRRIRGYARRVYDQGLGRSLWFVEGAHVDRVRTVIGTLAQQRQADLWSGVGLAATYAGAVSEDGLRALQAAAGGYAADLAQGSAFAAKARERAHNPAAHTELATGVLCAMSAAQAAAITDECLPSVTAPELGAEPPYEIWRQRIRARLASASL